MVLWFVYTCFFPYISLWNEWFYCFLFLVYISHLFHSKNNLSLLTLDWLCSNTLYSMKSPHACLILIQKNVWWKKSDMKKSWYMYRTTHCNLIILTFVNSISHQFPFQMTQRTGHIVNLVITLDFILLNNRNKEKHKILLNNTFISF
jgi:hypothetical protein